MQAATIALLLLHAAASAPGAVPEWKIDHGRYGAWHGDVAPPANISVPQAQALCASLPLCAGFTFMATSSTPVGIVEAFFKASAPSRFSSDPTWWNYTKPLPKIRTCSTTVASKLPFCDPSKSMQQRATSLVEAMSLDEKISMFMLTGMLKGLPRLGLAPFRHCTSLTHTA